jgi:hypothetical protein
VRTDPSQQKGQGDLTDHTNNDLLDDAVTSGWEGAAGRFGTGRSAPAPSKASNSSRLIWHSSYWIKRLPVRGLAVTSLMPFSVHRHF